jgi:hypothetical protein
LNKEKKKEKENNNNKSGSHMSGTHTWCLAKSRQTCIIYAQNGSSIWIGAVSPEAARQQSKHNHIKERKFSRMMTASHVYVYSTCAQYLTHNKDKRQTRAQVEMVYYIRYIPVHFLSCDISPVRFDWPLANRRCFLAAAIQSSQMDKK